MSEQQAEEALTPTPEQVQGYKERIRATLSIGQFNKFCASLPEGGLLNHNKHQSCIVIPRLASELLLVEVGDSVGIAAAKRHSIWMNCWPYEALVASDKELFFVSKSYEWQQKPMHQIVVSTGPLPYSTLLNRLVNQGEAYVYEVDDPRMIHSARMLCDRVPIKVFQAVDGIPVHKTRQHYEGVALRAVDSALTRTEAHFMK